MNSTRSSRKHQQQRLKKHQTACGQHVFFDLLNSEALLEKIEECLPPHRERLYPPTEVLSMFLMQTMSSDGSCQNSVNRRSVRRISEGRGRLSAGTGGYCRARQRLPLQLIRELALELGERVSQQEPNHWRWHGREVKVVDGTTVTMPDTVENQEAFPQQGNQKPGLGFPICRILGVTSLSSGMLLNAAIGRFNGKGSSEQALLRSVQDTFTGGDIVLADAFFPTYFFIAQMQEMDVDIIMEQHGSRRMTTDFRKGKRLGERDHLIEIKKPKTRPEWISDEEYDRAPERLILREFKAKNKVITTTLVCEKHHSKAELAALYQSRWNVELDLRNIKQTLGMNVLSCKTPQMAVKEIWTYLLAYNLIRLLMAQSASLSDILPRQLSFKHSLQVWLAASDHFRPCDLGTTERLFELIASRAVGNRPNRVEPRAVKRRPKPYPLLMVPRALARARILKNGHPKKLK